MPLYPDFERVYRPDTADALPSVGTPAVWLPLRGHDVVVDVSGAAAGEGVGLLPDADTTRRLLAPDAPLTLGTHNGVTYLACELSPDIVLPDNCRAVALRGLYGLLSEVEWQIAGYAAQILHWRHVSQFCPVCGHGMDPLGKEWMRACPNCRHTRYPNVSPAVLALVHDGADKVLLAHKPGWGDRYSILAGFALPGESLEECVRREVEEEVGAKVTDIAYQGSQPWPFPNQLMIGYTARYTGGDLRLDVEELDHAAWYDADALPSLPPALSLSRQIIDRWQASRVSKNL